MRNPDSITDDAIAQWHEIKKKDGFKVKSLRRIGGQERPFMEIAETNRPDILSNAPTHPKLAFLRQNSVVIVPVIKTREGIFTLLGEEYREGAARTMIGFPAESLDKNDETLIEAATRGILEETPIKNSWIERISEIDVGPKNYVSPGGTNEQVFCVRADIRLPDEIDINTLRYKKCGLAEESEIIVTHVRFLTRKLLYELEVGVHKLALLMILDEMRQS